MPVAVHHTAHTHMKGNKHKKVASFFFKRGVGESFVLDVVCVYCIIIIITVCVGGG